MKVLIISILLCGAVLTTGEYWVFTQEQTNETDWHRGQWISGTVKDNVTGAPFEDILVKWVGEYYVVKPENLQPWSGYTRTDALGQYRIFVPRNWSGVVEPVQEGLELPKPELG